MAFNEEKYRKMELRKATGTRVIKAPKPPLKGADYTMAFACVACRTSNKRHFIGPPCDYPSSMECPVCKNDASQWKKVEYLIEHGFFFQKIRPIKGSYESIPYPKTLADAKVFVVKYKQYARK